jgi:hypothetical protein
MSDVSDGFPTFRSAIMSDGGFSKISDFPSCSDTTWITGMPTSQNMQLKDALIFMSEMKLIDCLSVVQVTRWVQLKISASGGFSH